jgi:hypothetical protein
MDNEPTLTINSNGTKFWFLNGNRHRVDGPAIEFIDGTKFWYIHGNSHREDGPADEYANGDKIWYLNDKIHRVDGPACEWANGDKEWYLSGTRWHNVDRWLEANIYISEEEKVMLKLIHG